MKQFWGQYSKILFICEDYFIIGNWLTSTRTCLACPILPFKSQLRIYVNVNVNVNYRIYVNFATFKSLLKVCVRCVSDRISKKIFIFFSKIMSKWSVNVVDVKSTFKKNEWFFSNLRFGQLHFKGSFFLCYICN